MRIVFMGTPDFAVPCLAELLEAGHQVCGVFTQPDKPKGRKMVLTPPPVKELALEKGLPVYQPAKMRDGEALGILQELRPELIVVVAYGKILPKEILTLPPKGCVNVHGSLLPKYRGAAPIQWSVINGEKETGVTTMLMDEGLDTGDMLLRETVKIGENETAGELFDRLAPIGAQLLLKTLEGKIPYFITVPPGLLLWIRCVQYTMVFPYGKDSEKQKCPRRACSGSPGTDSMHRYLSSCSKHSHPL